MKVFLSPAKNMRVMPQVRPDTPAATEPGYLYKAEGLAAALSSKAPYELESILQTSPAIALRAAALGLAGAVVGAVLLRVLNATLGDCTGTMLRSVAYCVAAGVPALIVTYGGALLLKVPEAAMIGRLAGRLLHR